MTSYTTSLFLTHVNAQYGFTGSLLAGGSKPHGNSVTQPSLILWLYYHLSLTTFCNQLKDEKTRWKNTPTSLALPLNLSEDKWRTALALIFQRWELVMFLHLETKTAGKHNSWLDRCFPEITLQCGSSEQIVGGQSAIWVTGIISPWSKRVGGKSEKLSSLGHIVFICRSLYARKFQRSCEIIFWNEKTWAVKKLKVLRRNLETPHVPFSPKTQCSKALNVSIFP